MERKIEEYIKFYLGCEVAILTTGKTPHITKIIGLHENGNIQVAHAIEAQDYFHLRNMKLICRPLESMTEEEIYQYDKTKEDYMVTPGSFSYLLSKGFDIFNLHSDGLCLYRNDKGELY